MLGAWFLVLGAWFLVLGAWCLVLGAWFRKPGTRNPEPGTRNPEPGTRNPEPGTRNPMLSLPSNQLLVQVAIVGGKLAFGKVSQRSFTGTLAKVSSQVGVGQ